MESKVLKSLARIISYVFHPLLMPTYAIIIFFHSGHFQSIIYDGFKNSMYLIFFILTFLLPAIFIPMLNYVKLEFKRNISPKTIKLFVMFISVIVGMILHYNLRQIAIPHIILNIVLSSSLSTLACLIISIFWNISVYSWAISGLTGFILFLTGFLGLPVMLICLVMICITGVMASSRLYLKKHNPIQVYTGMIFGTLTVFTCMLIF